MSSTISNFSLISHSPNHIEACFRDLMDQESFSKLQCILNRIPETTKSLYDKYAKILLSQPVLIQNNLPGYGEFVRMQPWVYAFRFISDIGEHLKICFNKKDESEIYFLKLAKILLYHTLTSRYKSAHLSLLELEQLCMSRGMDLSAFFVKYSYKIIKVIVKTISAARNSKIGVIQNLTRSLEIFSINTLSLDLINQILISCACILVKSNHYDDIKWFLESLARNQRIELSDLVNNHIFATMVHLLLKKKLSPLELDTVLNYFAKMCSSSRYDLISAHLARLKSRVFLNYSSDRRNVTDSLVYLAKFEYHESELPFEDELEDEECFVTFLLTSFVGILLGIDEYFSSRKITYGNPESILQIESLKQVLKAFKSNQIKLVHIKLLSTLTLLIQIRTERNNAKLNSTLCDTWLVFVERLDFDLLKLLLVNICAVLGDLIKDCEEVAKIYEYMLIENDINSYGDVIRSLYFLPKIPALKNVHQAIKPHIVEEKNVMSIKGLEKALAPALFLTKQESHKCHLFGVERIIKFLRFNQVLLLNTFNDNREEPLDRFISTLIETMIEMSSTKYEDIGDMISQCIGLICAINPIRLDHLIHANIEAGKTEKVFSNLEDPEFVVELIEKLRYSSFSDQEKESELATYALQVVIKLFSIFNNKKIMEKLSYKAIEACNICKNTNYHVKPIVEIGEKITVYQKYRHRPDSYLEYINVLLNMMVSTIDNNKIKGALTACSFLCKFNQGLADYLVPLQVLHILLHQQGSIHIVITEILDAINGTCEKQSISEFDFKCMNMIFNILDSCFQLYCNEINAKGPSPRKITQKQLNDLNNFLSKFPKDKLAISASKFKADARALYYIEQYISEKKINVDPYATFMQHLYVSLEDLHEAAAIEIFRTSLMTITDEISTHVASGRYDRAFNCLQCALENSNPKEKNGLLVSSLKNLSCSGDFYRLFDKSKEYLTAYEDLKESLLPFSVEASWKLSKWDSLDNYLVENPNLDKRTENSSFVSGILLNSILKDESSVLQKKLKFFRSQLLKPLSTAMIDRSAYFRGYDVFVTSHMLVDFDFFIERTLNQVKEEPVAEKIDLHDIKLFDLYKLWNQRIRLVQPSLKSREPILSWQRAMIDVFIKKYGYSIKNRQGHIVEKSKLWLQSAALAREAGNYERAYNALSQAQRILFTPPIRCDLQTSVKYIIEKAKLHWDQGEKTSAIRSLKLTLDKYHDDPLSKHLMKRLKEVQKGDNIFPDLTRPIECDYCCCQDKVRITSFAELKIQLTYYCEEAAAALPETIFYMYEECVHLGVNKEETYFRLARYYDRLCAYYTENPQLCGDHDTRLELDNRYEPATQKFSQHLMSMSGDKEEVYTRLMEASITAFGMSLIHGVKYIRESMPRLLNIWYELGTKKIKGQNVASRAISSHIEISIRFIDILINKLPSYYFMSALSLLLSRITHPHSGISKKTSDILSVLLKTYPNQIMWNLIAPIHDENIEKKKSALQLISSAKKHSSRVEKIITDTQQFVRIILEICTNYSPVGSNKQKLKVGLMPLKKLCPAVEKFNSFDCKVMMPTQSSLNAVFPIESSRLTHDYEPFPSDNIPFVNKFGPECYIFHSAQQPRRIFIQCDDGYQRGLLCKPGDDLRKDSRCMEFFNLINRILRRDNQSNARFYEIKTFLVLPLMSYVGILEWVPGLLTMRSIIETLYKETKENFSIGNLYPKRSKEYNQEELYAMFCGNVLPRMQPPVLPKWFIRSFLEPTAWYMARLAFTRTTAVISMGGYIIGLGDRHLDNVLIDSNTGKTVHVDFNLLFHQGETLNVPERVPFRLTHNIVSAFGSLGYEGNFRKACEITMKIMRKEKDSLLTTLKPFIHDPCSDWIKPIHNRNEDKSAGNRPAKVKIEITERKLKGFPRSRKFKPLTLIDSYSVEAQVDNLIEESKDNLNLCQMYVGWCPHI